MFWGNKKESITPEVMEKNDENIVGKSEYPKEVYMIHNEFLTASEKLLKEAEEIISNSKLDINISNKGNLAIDLGFIGVKEAVEKTKNDQLLMAEKNRANAILRASSNILTHKWIPEKSVEEICKKWNLVFGISTAYKGFIPEKNLLEIKSFKEQYYDKFWLEVTHTSWNDSYTQVTRPLDSNDLSFGYNIRKSNENALDSLHICVPIKDMHINPNQTIENGYKIKNIEVPDPIVLVRRDFNGLKGYYIITAWGDEASDPIVVNQKNN